MLRLVTVSARIRPTLEYNLNPFQKFFDCGCKRTDTVGILDDLWKFFSSKKSNEIVWVQGVMGH